MRPCKRGHTSGRYKTGHCKQCKLDAMAVVRASPERRKWLAEYSQTARARELHKRRNEKYRAKPDKHEAHLAAKKRWYAKNKHRYQGYAHRRRAIMAKSQSLFTQDDVRRAIAGQKNKCWWCAGRLAKYHIDHRIPIARGGGSGPDNIVISCEPCNRSKSAKMPWEFAGRLL